MITTVSLSPAIDKRLEFDGLRLGATNRVAHIHTEAAGKAVDVALSARALGMDVRCIGLLAGNGTALTNRLDALGVAHSFLPAPGDVRVNQKLYDRQTGDITEINEPVPEAPEALLQAAENAAVEAARTSRYLVLTGSLPQKCPADWYARIIRRVHDEAPDCLCVLDAEGERFTLGVADKPWLVKPNLYELELAVGRSLTTRESVCEAAQTLRHMGPAVVVVSMGAEGALAVSAEEAIFVPALSISVKTTTGAGDAMVAGLLHGFTHEASVRNALRHGTASAAARCAYGGEKYLDAAIFAETLPKTTAFPL